MQLKKHLELHGLLHQNNHAYRPMKRTTTAIAHLMDTLYQSTDRNMISSLLALDQCAAFDCVSHKIFSVN